MEDRNINHVLSDFIENMTALSQSFPLIMSVVSTMALKINRGHRKYLEKHCKMTSQDENKELYVVPIERIRVVKRLRQQSSDLTKATTLIPRNFLVSFVSEFDCFLGSLLKVIYQKRPEILNDSSKQITYSELLAFDSLEDAKEQVLEKEIESVLRKSHSDHLSFLESKFGIKLNKDLDIWKDFIEITERRNLFVHANGIISSQYLKICKQNGNDIEGISIGTQLTVDSDYINKAENVIYHVSIRLAHVLWRKLFPRERKEADDNLNNICVELISRGKYVLALDLLEFGSSLPKHHDDTVKRMMEINLAQAYKRSGRHDKCKGILGKSDWSATEYKFKLALSVINDEYEQSAKLLRIVVNAEDLSEQQVIEWPLFKEFRKTEEFLVAFKDLFGKDYAQQEELIKEEFDSHMKSIFGENKEEIIEETADEVEKELSGEDS